MTPWAAARFPRRYCEPNDIVYTDKGPGEAIQRLTVIYRLISLL